MHCIFVFYLCLNLLTFGVFKECPKRNGYFSKADGGGCVGRDELGVRLKKTPDNCQKACDENPDCISFEIFFDECYLSSSCTYALADEDDIGQCLYVKHGKKLYLIRQSIFAREFWSFRYESCNSDVILSF